MNSLIKAGFTPIGIRENGEIFSLSPEERPGILQLFGQSGQGKTVTIQGIIISDIRNDRMGMFIDPWGDVIEEIRSRIPAGKADKVSVFEAQKVSLDENIKKFQKEIADSIKKGGFLLCRLDYRTLGEDAVKALGSQMVKIFLQIIGTKESSLIIDEAHNFIDEETLEIIIKNKIEKMSCILADQAPVHYQKDVLGRLFESTNHLLSYLIDKDSADLIAKYHPEIEPVKLTALEKYTFIAKINAKTDSPVTMKLRGIFPILV